MRCPKCGYISFDHLERCKKCGKDIAEATAELEGTVFEAVVPVFLQFEAGGNEEVADDMAGASAGEDIDLNLDETFEEIETGNEVSPGEEVELVLGDEEELPEMDAADATLAGEVNAAQEAPADTGDEGELVLELGDGQSGGEEIEGLQLDFSDIDISDLAPPVEEEEPEELSLASGDEAVPVMASGPAAAAGAAPGGLEDLEIDDLDLDAPPPVTGSAAGGRLPPAVKTGTALDDFDVDLGDLLADGKKEKSVDTTP